MIRLHDYWRSSASYRVRIALGLAGLEWDTVPVDLAAGAQRSPAHVARNPQELVPVLEIDGRTMTQSLAIAEYLDETRGLDLLPRDPPERARVRAVSYAVAMEIHPVCNLAVARFASDNSNGGITMESWMQKFIAPGLRAVEAMVDDGERCVGTTLSMADICLVPQLYNARRWGIDLGPLPKIGRIGGALEALPAFAAAHPDRTPR